MQQLSVSELSSLVRISELSISCTCSSNNGLNTDCGSEILSFSDLSVLMVWFLSNPPVDDLVIEFLFSYRLCFMAKSLASRMRLNK